jgi:hypothetical protein
MWCGQSWCVCGQSFCPPLFPVLCLPPQGLFPVLLCVHAASVRVSRAPVVLSRAPVSNVFMYARTRGCALTWLRPPASLPALTILCSHGCSGAGEDSRQRGRLTRDRLERCRVERDTRVPEMLTLGKLPLDCRVARAQTNGEREHRAARDDG